MLRPRRLRHCLAALAACGGLALAACGGDGGASTPDAGFGPDRPSKRSDIAAVADPGTDTVLIFGGGDGPIVNQVPSPSYLGDTWLWSPTSGWTEVSGAGPSARGRYALGYDPAGGRALLFGGRFRAAGASGSYTLHRGRRADDCPCLCL